MSAQSATGGVRSPAPAWFLAACLLLLAVRTLHCGPRIDEPHAWRQMDTAQYVRSFLEDGIDLLRPSVCWMGPYRTLVLECPLPEAVVALAMRGLGSDDLRVALGGFLLFFVAATLGFHRLATLLFGVEVARWATLLYLASPLSLVYSRAIHVDFAVIACAHAALLGWLIGLERGSLAWIAFGSGFAVLAALVKAPYLFLTWFPLLPFALVRERRGLFLRALPLFALPVLGFGLWRTHAELTNAAAPDWSFIPNYHRMTSMGGWYFGTLAQRLALWSWKVLALRLRDMVAGQAAIPLVVLGLLMLASRLRERIQQSAASLALWCVGCGVYVLVLFNLNLVHDYYQIPLVAPASLLAALPLRWLDERRAGWLLPGSVCALVIAANLGWAETHCFVVPEIPTAAGELVRAHTPEAALVIASWWQLDPYSPLVLYPAHRYGWSVGEPYLTQVVVERLRALGATHLALLRETPPVGPLGAYLTQFPRQQHSLPTGWRLFLYDLRRE